MFLSFIETTSTQDVARQNFVKSGARTVVSAERQSAGRGRMGKSWATAPRAIAVSACWQPAWPAENYGLLPLVAALAAVDAAGESGAPELRLKWPNDLVDEDHKKVGGILSEATGGVVTIGLGVNLYWPDAPRGYGAMFERDPGGVMAHQFARDWAGGLFARIGQGPLKWGRDDYRRLCSTLGAPITWEPDGAGQALDIGDGGGLIVRTDRGIDEIVSGQVQHVRIREG